MKLNQVNPVIAALYVHIFLLQQEAAAQIISFIQLANADSGAGNNSSGKSTGGSGNASAGSNSGNDDDQDSDEMANPSADLVKNTGEDIRLTDFENAGVAGAPTPDPDAVSKEDIRAEQEAEAMSPGGTGEDRIVGGDSNRDIDWNDIVEEGTGEADAASG